MFRDGPDMPIMGPWPKEGSEGPRLKTDRELMEEAAERPASNSPLIKGDSEPIAHNWARLIVNAFHQLRGK